MAVDVQRCQGKDCANRPLANSRHQRQGHAILLADCLQSVVCCLEEAKGRKSRGRREGTT